MKKKLFFLLILSSVLLNSCKKEKTSEPEEPVYKIKTVRSNIGAGSTTTYEYDTQGRITKITYENGAITEYSYNSNLATLKEFSSGGSLVSTYYIDLNADGHVTKIYTVPSNGFDEIFSYNSNKQLQTIVATGNGNPNTITFYYSNNELDSLRLTNNSVVVRRELYEYDIAVKNTIFEIEQEYNPFIHKQYSKAIKKLTFYYYNPSTGALLNTQVNNYTYETDALGRITRRILSGNGPTADVSYTYY